MIVSIIIPLYNEQTFIAEIIGKVFKSQTPGWNKQVIVIDDASTDNSPAILKTLENKYPFITLRHHTNMGKGTAIRTGLAKATGSAILIQDADLEYNPDDYPALLGALAPNIAAVFGSRMMYKTQGGYIHYIIGAKFLNAIVNFLFKKELTDVYTGYKLIRTDALLSLRLESKGFEIESEIASKLLKQKHSIVEVPISYKPRGFREGKKIRALDAIRGLITIVKIKFSGK